MPVTRLNEHYADAMRLSRLVLQAMSLSHEAGDQQAHSLMVDMDDLFRRWILQELDLRLAPDLRIDADEDVWLDEGRAVTMAPDLIVRRGAQVVLVGDATYSMGADGYLASRDYLKLVAYTTAMGQPDWPARPLQLRPFAGVRDRHPQRRHAHPVSADPS